MITLNNVCHLWKIKDRNPQCQVWRCTLSFIMESWHILSPLASGTSSMPISLALYLTPSPWNLPSRYSSVFSSTVRKEEKKCVPSLLKMDRESNKSIKLLSRSLLTFLLFFLEWDLGCYRGGGRGCGCRDCSWGWDAGVSRDSHAVLHLCRHGVEWASLDKWTFRGKADGSSVFRGSEGNRADDS